MGAQSSRLMDCLVADIYDAFACKCGDCRTSCCEGWRVSISENEYFRLVGMDCPAALRERLDGSLHVYENAEPARYAELGKDWKGRCRMHGTDGLCELQKACGAAALPEICRMYPRSVAGGDAARLTCALSCERVTEAALAADDLRVRREDRDVTPDVALPLTSGMLDVIVSRMDAFRAAKGGMGKRIARLGGSSFAGLEPARDARGALPVLLGLCDAFGRLSPSVRDYCDCARARYAEDASLYESDAAAFDAAHPDAERGAANVFLAHMLDSCYPFSHSSERDAFVSLVAHYAFVRFLTVACVSARMLLPLTYMGAPEREAKVADVIAGCFRMIEHSGFGHNVLLLLRRDGGEDIERVAALLAV